MNESQIGSTVLWFLSTWVMICLWVGVIGASLYTSYRTGLYMFSILAGGAIPVVIFYTYTLFSIWPPCTCSFRYGDASLAIPYSRVAFSSLAISILVSLRLLTQYVINIRKDDLS